MTAQRRGSSRAGVFFACILVTLLLAHLNAPVVDRARADDDLTNGNLSVVVTDDGTEQTAPVATSTTPPGRDEVGVDGILYIGGLNGAATASLNPLGGTVRLWFTVRNASTSAFDARARFWVTSLFGNRLAAAEMPVEGLQPGETRTVATELRGGGQWTLLNAHVTLTPPTSVDGVKLRPVTRDAVIVLFPWLLLVLLVILGTVIVIVRVVRSSASAPPVPPVVGEAA